MKTDICRANYKIIFNNTETNYNLSNNNNIEKSKEMIKNLKNLTKKSKKTDDIISPQDAIDLCLSTNTKKTEIQDENLIKFNDLIKKFGDILKHKENDLKKKRKR